VALIAALGYALGEDDETLALAAAAAGSVGVFLILVLVGRALGLGELSALSERWRKLRLVPLVYVSACLSLLIPVGVVRGDLLYALVLAIAVGLPSGVAVCVVSWILFRHYVVELGYRW
jgi:hypothetical protein